MAIARRVLLSTALLLATLAGHASASGTLPDAPSLLIAVAFCFGVSSGFGERRRTILATAGFAAGAQLVLHAVLSIGDHAHTGTPLVPTLRMTVAHVVVALVIAFVSVEADRLIAALGRLLGLAAFVCSSVPAIAQAPIGHSEQGYRRFLHEARSLRGPPVRS